MWVNVDGCSIPVLSRYEEALWQVAKTKKPNETLLPDTTVQALSRMCSYVHKHGVPLWSTWRATNTWRVFQLGRVPLPVFARSINLSSRHIGELSQFATIPPGTDMTVLYDGTGA